MNSVTDKKPFYITTTLPYVNGEPHIGFALEIITADVLARFYRNLGHSVAFNTGTDEHGINIYRKALELGQDVQEYTDEVSAQFQELKELLDLSYTHFVRTTDEAHIKAAQEFWRRSDANGDIYKKAYQVKYCSGCELEKTDSELNDDGRCELHPSKEIETIDEENYFFRWSKYQEALLALYKEKPQFVLPKKRQNEIQSFVERGLQDFSISRLRDKLPWGVPVPGDDAHVMYVWFDALVSYISTLGWPDREEDFTKWWPGVQIAGKDNVRQQAAMWQAMLCSVGLPFSEQILINGFINVNGQKMSKSLGNVITPKEMVEKFGTDGTRYLLLTLAHLGEDSDISWERATEKYNADLANGLGNLVSRVIKLAEKMTEYPAYQTVVNTLAITDYNVFEYTERIMEQVREANEYMSKEEPWILVKTDQVAFDGVMHVLLEKLGVIVSQVEILMPDTALKIQTALKTGKTEPLFQRL